MKLKNLLKVLDQNTRVVLYQAVGTKEDKELFNIAEAYNVGRLKKKPEYQAVKNKNVELVEAVSVEMVDITLEGEFL